MFFISASSKERKPYFEKLIRRLQPVFDMHSLSFISYRKTNMILSRLLFPVFL